ncbi:Saccharopine dehydrogenase-domain-containing protein [Scleroderma citrinum]
MLDILILGATGYTGRLISRYLAAHRQRATFTFGLAARSQQKLKALTDELGDSVFQVATFIVDVTQPDNVEMVIQEARVIINAVGPFWRWGTPVVEACVRHKRHYVDISGEFPWVREIIHKQVAFSISYLPPANTKCAPFCRFDHAAAKSNTLIVPCAGLDSVPTDLITYVANKTLKASAGPTTGIDMSTSAWELDSFGLSGGSFSTFLTALEHIPKHKLKAAVVGFALSPVRGTSSPRRRAFYTLPILDPPIRGTLSTHSSANTQVVQRSWGLFELATRYPKVVFPPELSITVDTQGYSYGTAFKYEEFLALPSRLHALRAFTFLISVSLAIIFFPPARWIARKLMPQPGRGPTDEQLEAGSVRVTNITTSTPDSDGRTVSARTILKGKGEPLYLLTSILVSEAALAIVLDKDGFPPLGRHGGVLTPATAFGDVLIRRLHACGHFNIESEVLP